VERFEAYLDFLSREETELDRLLDVARRKRQAILRSAADEIVALSNAEDSLMDELMRLRKLRKTEMAEFYSDLGYRGARETLVPRPYAQGRLRQVILSAAPENLRPVLEKSLRAYESKLLQLRREAKVNNTLLSDRLLLLHHTFEKIMSSAAPREAYGRPGRRAKKAGGPAGSTSLLVDQKV